MKKLTKLALAIGVSMASSAALAQVTLVDDQGEPMVIYDYGKMEVENGTVTITGATYVWGDLPGFEPGDRTCGTGTTDTGGTCVVNLSQVCGANTIEENGQCIGEAPDLTAPTLGITSSPSSMGDGVSTATLTFQFSRAVQGFTAGDISVSQGSISNFTQVNSSRWQATYNRSGNNSGSVAVSVSAGSYEGTNGVGGGSASRSISLVGGSTNVGNCTVPANVSPSSQPGVGNFGTPQGSLSVNIPRKQNVIYSSFSTSSALASGQIDLAGTTQTSNYIRKMWISNCPGGAPLSNRCVAEGNLLTMRWIRGTSRVSCQLDANSTYYFNLSHGANDAGCNSSTCKGYIQHIGGW